MNSFIMPEVSVLKVRMMFFITDILLLQNFSNQDDSLQRHFLTKTFQISHFLLRYHCSRVKVQKKVMNKIVFVNKLDWTYDTLFCFCTMFSPYCRGLFMLQNNKCLELQMFRMKLINNFFLKV